MPAELILTGGVVRSPDDGWRPHAALALGGGRVIGRGTVREVAGAAGPGAEVLDLDGGCALPGLTDSHLHLLGYALARRRLPAGEADSLADLSALVAAAAAGRPADAWILGRGWDQERWPERRMPNRDDLDAAGGGRPVLLGRVCGHVVAANSAALALAGVDDGTPDPPGGRFDRDESGRPTGILRETATELALRMVPQESEAARAGALREALRECLSLGITQVQTDDAGSAGGLGAALDLFGAVAGPGGVPVRVTMMVPAALLAEARERGVGPGWGDAWLRAGHVKVFADGSLGARTAALRAPYADAPGTRGVLVHEQDALDALLGDAHAAGWQLGVHAIGDAAAHAVLRSLARAGRAAPRRDHRHRLIHCQVTGDDTLRLMRTAGVVADIQPGFLRDDRAWRVDRLGPERARTSYAWGTMRRLGIPACGGSDCPISPLDPLRGIAAAVDREGPERMAVGDALGLYTDGAAWATFEEGRRGTLAPGMAADVTVLDRDPLAVPPGELEGLRARATVVAGRVAFALG